jgi:hypothetical protein
MKTTTLLEDYFGLKESQVKTCTPEQLHVIFQSFDWDMTNWKYSDNVLLTFKREVMEEVGSEVLDGPSVDFCKNPKGFVLGIFEEEDFFGKIIQALNNPTVFETLKTLTKVKFLEGKATTWPESFPMPLFALPALEQTSNTIIPEPAPEVVVTEVLEGTVDVSTFDQVTEPEKPVKRSEMFVIEEKPIDKPKTKKAPRKSKKEHVIVITSK